VSNLLSGVDACTKKTAILYIAKMLLWYTSADIMTAGHRVRCSDDNRFHSDEMKILKFQGGHSTNYLLIIYLTHIERFSAGEILALAPPIKFVFRLRAQKCNGLFECKSNNSASNDGASGMFRHASAEHPRNACTFIANLGTQQR
jgi:hypothetical protein